MSILDKFLKKVGVKSPDELSSDEKKTYTEWQKILSKEELTLADIKLFCQTSIEIIEGKWKDLSLEQTKKAELIPYHTVYKTLLSAIDAPRSARENLEATLNQLL